MNEIDREDYLNEHFNEIESNDNLPELLQPQHNNHSYHAYHADGSFKHHVS